MPEGDDGFRLNCGSRQARRQRQIHVTTDKDGPIIMPGQSSRPEIHRRRADEGGHERVGWRGVQALRRIDLSDSAALQHNDAIAQSHGFDLIVGDIDDRGVQPLLQFLQLDAHRRAKLGVQIGQRSSNKKSLGLRTIARPIATRCR